MRIRVHFVDGNHINSRFNGTRDEILAYYVGQPFQFGDTESCPRDKMVKACRVEFMDEPIGCHLVVNGVYIRVENEAQALEKAKEMYRPECRYGCLTVFPDGSVDSRTFSPTDLEF